MYVTILYCYWDSQTCLTQNQPQNKTLKKWENGCGRMLDFTILAGLVLILIFYSSQAEKDFMLCFKMFMSALFDG